MAWAAGKRPWVGAGTDGSASIYTQSVVYLLAQSYLVPTFASRASTPPAAGGLRAAPEDFVEDLACLRGHPDPTPLLKVLS